MGTNSPGRSEVLVQVLAPADGDLEELAEHTALLREDLLDLDIVAVEPVTEDVRPDGSKGSLAAVGGWLVVNMGPAALSSVVRRIVTWATQNSRSVEVSFNGDVLKVTGVSPDQQNRLIDEWLTRQAART